MKRQEIIKRKLVSPSSLARGKWIEALRLIQPPEDYLRLPSQEGSGLKRSHISDRHFTASSLPSQEGSGLKHTKLCQRQIRNMSSLARGKWIEALRDSGIRDLRWVFPRKREVD